MNRSAYDKATGRRLGTYLRQWIAPGGETIIECQAGPNPHETRHYDARTVDWRNDDDEPAR